MKKEESFLKTDRQFNLFCGCRSFDRKPLAMECALSRRGMIVSSRGSATLTVSPGARPKWA